MPLNMTQNAVAQQLHIVTENKTGNIKFQDGTFILGLFATVFHELIVNIHRSTNEYSVLRKYTNAKAGSYIMTCIILRIVFF
jgi:hypothetical protein